MTIKHADIIRAILDGKTVQEHVDDIEWVDLEGAPELQIIRVANYPGDSYRVKPEPVVQWCPVWGEGLVSGARSVRTVECGSPPPHHWLRVEFVDGKCVSVSLEDA